MPCHCFSLRPANFVSERSETTFRSPLRQSRYREVNVSSIWVWPNREPVIPTKRSAERSLKRRGIWDLSHAFEMTRTLFYSINPYVKLALFRSMTYTILYAYCWFSYDFCMRTKKILCARISVEVRTSSLYCYLYSENMANQHYLPFVQQKTM